MAWKTIASLKALFVAGYKPTQSDYADILDTCGRNYRGYTINATQTSTNDPVDTVYENNLSAAPVWARTGAGVYTATLANAFTANKTWIDYRKDTGITSVVRTDVNTITVTCTGDDILTNWALEIRVYN